MSQSRGINTDESNLDRIIYVSIGQGGRALGNRSTTPASLVGSGSETPHAMPPAAAPSPPEGPAAARVTVWAPPDSDGGCPICLETVGLFPLPHSCPNCGVRSHTTCHDADLAARRVDICPICRFTPDLNALRDQAMQHRARSCWMLCLSLFFYIPTPGSTAATGTSLVSTVVFLTGWYLWLTRVFRLASAGKRVAWLRRLLWSVASMFAVALSLLIALVVHRHSTALAIVESVVASALNATIVAYAVYAGSLFHALQAVATRNTSPSTMAYVINPFASRFPTEEERQTLATRQEAFAALYSGDGGGGGGGGGEPHV